MLIVDDSFDDLVRCDECPFTRAVYIDIISDLTERSIHSASQCDLEINHVARLERIMTVVPVHPHPKSSLLGMALDRCKGIHESLCLSSTTSVPPAQPYKLLAPISKGLREYEDNLREHGRILGAEYAQGMRFSELSLPVFVFRRFSQLRKAALGA